MAQVELTRRAHDDLRRLRAFLAENSPSAAERASDAIVQGMRRLGDMPNSAPKLPDTDIRELVIRFGHYGYIVRYIVVGDRVIVARIFHALEPR